MASYSYNNLIHDLARRHAESLPYRGRVVDLGCGSAPYRETILRSAEEYVGVDWPNSEHDQSRVDVFADLMEPLPFDDGFADTVVAFQVMEHLPEPHVFLAECYRILKPGGRLFLTTPFMHKVHEPPHDYYRYTRYGLEYLLGKHEFTEIEVRELSGFWQMLAMKCNYCTARFAPGVLKFVWLPLWLVNQWLGAMLDRLDNYPEETITYAAGAVKPPIGG